MTVSVKVPADFEVKVKVVADSAAPVLGIVSGVPLIVPLPLVVTLAAWPVPTALAVLP